MSTAAAPADVPPPPSSPLLEEARIPFVRPVAGMFVWLDLRQFLPVGVEGEWATQVRVCARVNAAGAGVRRPV